MGGINKVETISFVKTIVAGATDVLQERVKGAGTVEKIRGKFYTGQEHSLKVRPFIEHKGAKIEDMITYASTSRGYLSGDDESFEITINMPVQNDDFIKIHVENTSIYDYTLNIKIEIDYFAGTKRIIGGVI